MFRPRNTVSKICLSGIGVHLWPIVQIAVGETKVNHGKREALGCLTVLLSLLNGRIVPSSRMMARTTAYDVLHAVKKYLFCQNGGIR